jgi:hypothetical protein
MLGAFFGGALAGLVLTVLVLMIPASLLGNLNTSHASGKWIISSYLVELLLIAASLVYLFVAPAARRLPATLRLFLLTVAWVMLGGVALCNIVMSSAIFASGGFGS